MIKQTFPGFDQPINDGNKRTLAASVPIKLQRIVPKARNKTFFITSQMSVFIEVDAFIVIEGNLITGKPVHVMNRAASKANNEIKL